VARQEKNRGRQQPPSKKPAAMDGHSG